MNLLLLGLLRLAPAWYYFLNNPAFQRGPCSKYQFQNDRERLLTVWSLITTTICFICAFNIEDKFLSKFLSFTFTLSLFTTEYLMYRRLGVWDFCPVSFFTVSDRDMELAVWGLITITICYICALKHKEGLMSKFLSFVFAITLYTTEHQIYRRKGNWDLSSSSFLIGALLSWMMLLLEEKLWGNYLDEVDFIRYMNIFRQIGEIILRRNRS